MSAMRAEVEALKQAVAALQQQHSDVAAAVATEIAAPKPREAAPETEDGAEPASLAEVAELRAWLEQKGMGHICDSLTEQKIASVGQLKRAYASEVSVLCEKKKERRTLRLCR